MLLEKVMAIDIHGDMRYADHTIFHKIGDQYHEVTYLNWHTEGTTWIGGTFDVGFESREMDDIQIDPYSYLYVTAPCLEGDHVA